MGVLKYELIGLTVGSEKGLCSAALAMQELLNSLCETEFVTYDRIIYPYADSLLLSKRDGYPILFGQKALLWGVDLSSLERAAKNASLALGTEIEYSTAVFECCAADIEKFLAKPEAQTDTYSLGGFHPLTSGTVTPWGVREYSRRFCSFCEHISRMNGVEVVSLNAGYICVKDTVSQKLLRELKKLYEAKTGGLLKKRK